MHPEGQWLALEHLGEPVGVFYQRRWEKQKGRAWDQEQARVEDLEQTFPTGTTRIYNFQPFLLFRWKQVNDGLYDRFLGVSSGGTLQLTPGEILWLVYFVGI